MGADAAFGTGVYLTGLPPTEDPKRIASNNWGHSIRSFMVEAGRVDYAIKLRIPKSRLVKAESRRDIWIHKGDIKLSDYEYTVIQRQPVQSSSHTKFVRDRQWSLSDIAYVAMITLLLVVATAFCFWYWLCRKRNDCGQLDPVCIHEPRDFFL